MYESVKREDIDSTKKYCVWMENGNDWESIHQDDLEYYIETGELYHNGYQVDEERTNSIFEEPVYNKPKKKPKVIYIDMDDVLCDFMGEFKKKFKEGTLNFPQSKVGFFKDLPPIELAIESVNKLRENPKYDVWVLTAPSTRNPSSYTEKRIWIEEHFDYEFTNKLILSPNKGLLRGDILIDDHIDGKGQEDFRGKLIQFGSEKYSDWKSVMEYLND